MPLPFSFISGEVARSSQVNANFNYIMDIIGQLSTPGSIASLGEFKLGPRMMALFSAAQDTGPDATAFFQLAWNVNYNKVGTVWRYDRRITNNPATTLRIGKQGLEVLTTSAPTGDLNNQLTKVMGITAVHHGEDRMFVKDDLHLQNYDGTARTIQDYRQTFVALENPIPIYHNKSVPKGTTVFNAYNLGVPAHAKSVQIYMHVTAFGDSGAGMHAYQRRSGGSTHLNFFRGFVTHATKDSGLGMRAGAQGIVPLGMGAVRGDFVIHRTAPFYTTYVYIMGYWT